MTVGQALERKGNNFNLLRMLGALTVSTLRGESGYQRKEVEKLVYWLADQPRPHVVNVPGRIACT